MGACCFRDSSDPSTEFQDGGIGANPIPRRASVPVGNKFLCRPPPTWTSEQPITQGQLLSKRDDFWETSPLYGGKAEIWQALRAAGECDDAATAQAIIDAVNVTLPNGDLTVVYDELGNKYEVPVYCLAPPTNLVEEGSSHRASDAAASPAPGEAPPPAASAAAGPPKADSDSPAAAPAEPAADAQQLSLRLRLSSRPGEADLPWAGPASTTVGQLKEWLSAQQPAAAPRGRLRCIFGGQILTDSKPLSDCRVVNDAVVIVAVSQE